MRINFMTFAVSSLLTIHAFADVANNFAQYSGQAQSLNGMLQSNGGQLNIQRVVNGQTQTQSFQPANIPNAQSNPAQTSYYGKTQAEITQAAGQALSNTSPCTKSDNSGCNATAGNTVSTNFTSAPKFVVDPTSPSIARNLLIQQDAENLAQGKPGKYVNCDEKNVCETTYTNQACTVQHQLNLSCTNTLTPEITSMSFDSECNHMVGSGFGPSFVPGPSSDGWCYIEIKNYGGGAGGNFHQGGSRQFTLPPNTTAVAHMFFRALDSNWNFNPNRGSVSFTASGSGLPTFNYINPPFADNAHGNVLWQEGEQSFYTGDGNEAIPYTYNYSVDSHNSAISEFHPALLYIRYPASQLDQTIVKNTWVNSCQNNQALSQCTQTSNECTQGAETREIGHKSVTADCWQYTTKYQCGQESNSCGSSVQGCDQINSQCNSNVGGVCISYTDTFQCPKTQCTGQGMMCGDNFFCIKGDCSPINPSANENFGKSDAEMAAVTNSMTDIISDTNTMKAFSGQPMRCKDLPFGMLNCCQDSGWGKEIGLMNCSQEEQQLGDAKQKGLAVEVGRYCDKKVLGVCITHKKSYCTFSNLLAYDVQTQGRKQQLNRGFGSGENPDCSGLSIQDLQSINYKAIDFSNVVQQVTSQSNFPNSQAVQDAIQKEISNNIGRR